MTKTTTETLAGRIECGTGHTYLTPKERDLIAAALRMAESKGERPMIDIVERLRKYQYEPDSLLSEAADEIERLRVMNAKLQAQLEVELSRPYHDV